MTLSQEQMLMGYVKAQQIVLGIYFTIKYFPMVSQKVFM